MKKIKAKKVKIYTKYRRVKPRIYTDYGKLEHEKD